MEFASRSSCRCTYSANCRLKNCGRSTRSYPQIGSPAPAAYVPGLGLGLAEAAGLGLVEGLADGLGLGSDLDLFEAALFWPNELFCEPVVRVLASPCRWPKAELPRVVWFLCVFLVFLGRVVLVSWSVVVSVPAEDRAFCDVV